MSGKPDFGAALRVLGSDLKDIAQHKREEQLMKLVREQREADMEEERAQRNRELGFRARQEAERQKADDERRAAEREQDWLRNSIPVPSGEVGGRLFPNMTRVPVGIYNALKPERPVRDPVADFKEEWLFRKNNPLPESGGGGGTKTPDMGGLFSTVDARDPALAAAIANAGRTGVLHDAAARLAFENKVQPEAVAGAAYAPFAADPAQVDSLSALLPPGLVQGGYVPEHKGTGFLGAGILKRTHEAQYLSTILSATEEARSKLRDWGKNHKTMTDKQVENIIINVSAKRGLDADGQKAVRDEIYLGRAAENLPGVGGAPGESAAQRRARELASGGGA